MPFIRVNDIFDELIEENNRLLKEIKFSKKLINVLNKYKNEFNLITNQLKTYLNSNQLKCFEELSEEYKEVMKTSEELSQEIDCKTSIQSNDEKNINLNTNTVKSELKTNFNENSNKMITKIVFKCSTNGCNKLFTEEEVFQKHINTEHKSVTNIESNEESVNHMITNETNGSTEALLKCPVIECNKLFTNEDILKEHMKCHFSKQFSTSDEKSLQFNPNIQSIDKQNIRIELNIRKTNSNLTAITRVLRCTTIGCKKFFINEESLLKHINNEHKSDQQLTESLTLSPTVNKNICFAKISPQNNNKVIITENDSQKLVNIDLKIQSNCDSDPIVFDTFIKQYNCKKIVKLYKCDEQRCHKKWFKTKDLLRNHLNVDHKNTININKILNQNDSKNIDFFIKEKKCEKFVEILKCPDIKCNDLLFSDKPTFIKHLNHLHKTEKIKDNLFEVSKTTKININDSIENKSITISNKLYKCMANGCHKLFFTEELLEEHIKSKHKTEDNCDSVIIPIEFKCPNIQCNQLFPNDDLLKEHMKAMHSSKRVKNRQYFDKLQKAIEMKRQEFDKKSNSTNFDTQSLLITNEDINRQKDDNQSKCDYITKFITDFPECSSHLPVIQENVRIQQNSVIVKKEKTNDSSETVSCDSETNPEFNSFEYPFKCAIDGCDQSFSSENDFLSHQNSHSMELFHRLLQSVHKPVEQSVEQSMGQSVEQSVKEFIKCSIDGCDQVFNCELKLKTHLTSHSRIAEKQTKLYLECDYPKCKYKTNFVSNLKSHKLYHKKTVFNCSECRKQFKTKFLLNIHLKTHKSDKLFVCQWPECMFKSMDYTTLTTHINNTHSCQKL